MALRISCCPFTLLFKHPFGTAHGMRTGTDSLFVQVEEHGLQGFGEVTLPPYLTETVADALQRLRSVANRGPWTAASLYEGLNALPEFLTGSAGCRAGLSTALIDLIGKQRQVSVRVLLDIRGSKQPITLMTLGISELEELPGKLNELPESDALKVKAGDPGARARLAWLTRTTDLPVLIDGNQGMASVAEALNLAMAVDPVRLLGFEQPFTDSHNGLNKELAEQATASIIADESIQTLEDLEAKHTQFQGVNLKLMKCGGLDLAAQMARRSRELEMKLMLGSMSESSLGCTAMAALSGVADLVDLDGPWLIRNDPFVGIRMEDRKLVVPNEPGIGVHQRSELSFDPIDA